MVMEILFVEIVIRDMPSVRNVVVQGKYLVMNVLKVVKIVTVVIRLVPNVMVKEVLDVDIVTDKEKKRAGIVMVKEK
jgi:hypothetical protein